jgi:hypothetical protein
MSTPPPGHGAVITDLLPTGIPGRHFFIGGNVRLMGDQWGDFNISTMNYNELLAGTPFVVADDYHVYRLSSSGRLLRQPVGTKFPQNWRFCGVLLGRRFRWFRAYAVFQCLWLGHRVVVEVPMHKMERVAARADQWG